MFALDETLSALSHVQKCFGSFLLGKVMGIRYSAKAEATVQKAAVVGAETPGAGWLEGGMLGGLCWDTPLAGSYRRVCSYMFLRHRCGGEWANAPASHLAMLTSKRRGLPAGPELAWFISFRKEGGRKYFDFSVGLLLKKA